jgi:hypothetical protein
MEIPMFNKYFKKAFIPFLALASILACAPFAAATPQPAETLNALYTSAAQTLNAMSTQGSFTSTVQPLGTATLSLSSATPIVFLSSTPVPPLPPVTRCDAAAFVSDVTYSDGSVVAMGGTFTKIWRIKNVGTCTWNTSYDLVFVSGERFGAPNAVALPEQVSPGESVDIPVNLTAPSRSGSYTGYWRLRNASGVLFGVGNSDANVYVDVRVSGYTVAAYDFIANACDANWTNDSRDDLPCPGTEGDDRGFVVVRNSPNLEDGRSLGNALLTYPEKGTEGFISGKFPNFRVENGDRFQAYIGCLERANDCDMIYRLQYQIGNGDVRSLGSWREIYDEEYYPISIDLSFLSGERVKFIFTVYTNGNAHEDFALWVMPRITRQSSQAPTATPTNTATPTATPTVTSYP